MSRRIDKQQAHVRVSFAGGDPADGYLCLTPRAESRESAETMLDLLNSAKRVVPFLLQENGEVVLLSVRYVDWVLAGPGVDLATVVPPTYIVTREERVELCFADGRRMDGKIQIEVKDDFTRVSDFINSPERFYPVRTRLGLMLVNKERVSETRLIEAQKTNTIDLDAAA